MLLPQGEWWIGDPSYVFSYEGVDNLQDKWYEIRDNVDFLTVHYSELDDGKIKIWAAPTVYGNGWFIGSNGFSFPVRSGLLSVISKDTIKYLYNTVYDLDLYRLLEMFGLFIDLDHSFCVKIVDGEFSVNDIIIDTKVTVLEEEDL